MKVAALEIFFKKGKLDFFIKEGVLHANEEDRYDVAFSTSLQ